MSGDERSPFGVQRSAESLEPATPNGERPTPNEPNFRRLYVIVLAELAVTIAILYAFTRVFA